jgi:hypothetical protein
MNLTKKQRERRSLDAVLERIALAPNDVNETEEPDFLLTIDGAVVGAEVTELFLPSPADAVLPMQATENEERLMVEKARQQAIQRAVPPQQLQVRLRPQSLTKPNRDRVATILCDYVASNFAAPGEVKSGVQPLPREIVHITMYGLRKSEHQWNGPCSGWVNSEFADGFQGAIAEKNLLVAQDAAAHAPHHRPMPTHQGCKSCRVAAADVGRQQLPIGQARPIPQKHRPAKMLDDPAHLACHHLASFALASAVVGSVGFYPYYYRQQPL